MKVEVMKVPTQDPYKSQMDAIDKNIDNMYKSTYYNTSFGSKHLDDLNSKINDHIDRITNFNMNTSGIPSISKLYSRLRARSKETSNFGKTKDITELFDSAVGFEDFYSNFMSNRYLVEVDAEIDAVCKYFPELVEALDVKKEGVLSADHFSKDYLTVNTPEGEDKEIFDERIKELKEKYDLLNLIDEIYDNTARYGEQYLYVVPYSLALSRLLKDKPKTSLTQAASPGGFTLNRESAIDDIREFDFEQYNSHYHLSIKENKLIINNGTTRSSAPVYESAATYIKEAVATDKINKPVTTGYLNPGEAFDLDIVFNTSGIIESAVMDVYRVYEAPKKHKLAESVSSEFSVLNEKELAMVYKDKDSGQLKMKKKEDISRDGLIDKDGKKKEDYTVKVPGCVVSKIKRNQIIPLYIQGTDKCLGYYYIELRSVEAMQDFQGYNYMMSDSLTSIRGSNSGMNAPFNVIDPTRQEHLLQYLAGQLSRFIDKEFVQTNQDLAEEIYMILKQNDLFNTPSIDMVKVTFVPPEDMIHFYFKLNPDTHRGVSDLEKAMIPAKLYACMYITDSIGQMVRGQDKRVYYVRQNVETNISQTLLNTINQIKQGNFGLRQFSSINNVLNMTGRFNDFVIPTNASGDAPVQIEVLPGQQFTDNSERMNALKEQAITSVDVPFEIIQTRQSVDYAMQLSMSSSRFLRKIYHRQGKYIPFLNRLITRLYNYQYGEKKELTVTLPPPMFLNMANTNQMVDNIKQFITTATEYEMNNMEDEKLKNNYMQQLFEFYVGTHVDLAQHEKVLKKAKMITEKEKKGNEEGGGEGY